MSPLNGYFEVLRVIPQKTFSQSDEVPEDLNRDGVVDDRDLLMVLFNFGRGCGVDLPTTGLRAISLAILPQRRRRHFARALPLAHSVAARSSYH
jgi:hypothetical protein